MNPKWFVFFCFYKLVTRHDFVLADCGSFDSTTIRSDSELYDAVLRYHEEKTKKIGLGIVLIVHSGDSIPTVFEGNPLLEEDHFERQRVFFTDRDKFFETLED
jgi:hypothetical protein